MGREKQDPQREPPQNTGDTLSQASPRSEILFGTAPRESKLQTICTRTPRRHPRRMAVRSRGTPYIDFTTEAPKLKRQLEQARSRQQALGQAGQRGSEEYTAAVKQTKAPEVMVPR
ncbi:uncharacterized protein AKAW2_50169S [Aspergillus luchuensis]|uniref:Uncharacterized protein n=2 Tax=Aspergillus subgen. Circumdati TaxID=2720871 RepID=A0A9W6EH40_ASPNG|nr:uncharacterized protein AKAW2_50169S [Aspergillus luchuensis]BCR99826.1 hypothetical protein AKAW2_50169S [Aspergillus luchuensis]GLA56067.1 hypothetical protein AnigIFM63604_004244 [Aspergillus niger]